MRTFRPFLYIFSLIFSLAVLSSCGSHKKTVSRHHTKIKSTRTYGSHDERTLAYIHRFKDVAKKEMKNYKIPASITLAQAILESKAGESYLAREANNHFGIKCGDDWTGKRLLHDDDHKNECFRVYDTPEESFRDHSKFLASKRRYAFLFRFPLTDYEAWAKGLKQAGYATDRSYPQKLIYLIEKYHLDKYDREVLEEMKIKVPETVRDTTKGEDKGEKIIYEVKAGETLFSIAHKFGIPVREIKELNNLVDFDIYEGQILVLKVPEGKVLEDQAAAQVAALKDSIKTKAGKEIQNAKAKAVTDEKKLHHPEERNEPNPQAVKALSQVAGGAAEEQAAIVHTVQPGETLYAIARRYGLGVDDLKKANRLTDNHLKVGQKLLIPTASTTGTEEQKAPQAEASPSGTKAAGEQKQETGQQELPAYHVVQPGETLYRIHVKYNIPIERLRELNGLKDNTIYVGQKIRLR
jgi:LysM repeat protein